MTQVSRLDAPSTSKILSSCFQIWRVWAPSCPFEMGIAHHRVRALHAFVLFLYNLKGWRAPFRDLRKNEIGLHGAYKFLCFLLDDPSFFVSFEVTQYSCKDMCRQNIFLRLGQRYCQSYGPSWLRRVPGHLVCTLLCHGLFSIFDWMLIYRQASTHS